MEKEVMEKKVSADNEIKIRSISNANMDRRHIEAVKAVAKGMEEIEKYIVLKCTPTYMLANVLRERMIRLSRNEREMLAVYGVESRRKIERDLEQLKSVETMLEELEQRYRQAKGVVMINEGQREDERIHRVFKEVLQAVEAEHMAGTPTGT